MLTIQHDSTQIEQLVTANDDPSYQTSICSVLQIDIQYDRSSFIVTSCSIRVHLCRFNNIFNPLSQTLVEYFLSLSQIDFQYAFSRPKRWFLRPPVYTTSLSESTSGLMICQLPLTICNGLGVLDNPLSFSRMCALFTVLSFRICFNFSPFYHSVIPSFHHSNF